jgi:diguanylate cyclase (GGDEF)-like protein/PAS domain S-box-containing protein
MGRAVNDIEAILFRALDQSAPVGLMALDRANAICYANASAHRMLGSTNLVGVPALSIVHPDSLTVMIQTTIDFTGGPKIAVPSTFYLLHASGDYVPVEIWVQQSFDTGPVSFVLALRDATAEQCYDRYIMAVHHHEPVEVSTRLLVQYLDAKAPAADHAVLWGWDGLRFRYGVSARIPVDLLLAHPFATTKVQSLNVADGLVSGETELDCEWIAVTFDVGDPLRELEREKPYVRADAVVSYTYENGKQHVICAVISVSPYALRIGAGSKLASERAAQSSGLAITHFENAERLLRDAVSDSLTGLLNRRGLYAVLAEYFADKAIAASIVLLDLDGFKRINDRFGHAAGDDVLIEVGRRLTRLVGSERLVARLGGDEFALLVEDSLLPGVTDILYQTICEPMTISGMKMSVGVSFGTAHLKQNSPDIESVFREADERMYEQKGRLRLERRSRPREAAAELPFIG